MSVTRTEAEHLETVTGFLTQDHREADNLLAAAGRHGAQREWRACAGELSSFRAALETHMQLEEQVLFPAFERATGTDSGPTAVMRAEHRQMLEALGAIESAAAATDSDHFDSLFRSFTTFMDAHSMKEERILYPMCDRMLDTLTAAELQRQLAALRKSR
jgi:iron-sulfur cluster repair protein YtfE (RIC family)